MGAHIPKSMRKLKIVRTATVPVSLDKLLVGQLAHLNMTYKIVAISSGGEKLTHVRDREGVSTIAIPIARKIAPIDDIISIFKMQKVLRLIRPVVVHSITPKAGLASMLGAFLAGVPIRIHTFTGLIFPTSTGLKKILLIIVDKFICILTTVVIPEGQGVKKDLEKYNITSKPMNILANGNVNGINIHQFNPQRVFSLPPSRYNTFLESGKLIFCYIGRINRDKGVAELLEAFSNMSLERKSVQLIIIGKVEEDHNIPAETLEKLYVGKEIFYFGYQDDVRPYLAKSDVVVLPSYREGFPNILIQAGAMGLPCIASNVSGCNEIIYDEVNGLLIEPKETGILEDSMKRLVDDSELRNRLSSNSRALIIDRFEDKTVWMALDVLYRNQLKYHR
jgi:glycosyltransferase involved in cell wall biosynthesis